MEIITVYSEDHMKSIYSVGKMQSSYDVKAGGTHSNHCISGFSGYLTENFDHYHRFGQLSL
jgi:hypothetical protein